MEKRASREVSKPLSKGFNITPLDIANQIQEYKKDLPVWKERQKSSDYIERSNGHVFGDMCEDRLRVLTNSSPKLIIDRLKEIYTYAENLRSQGLDILEITTKVIRKYRFIGDYIDLFAATDHRFLDRIADTEWLARDKEAERLRPILLNCEVALTLKDYNALNKDAPQELKNHPGKTMAEIMTKEELTLHINKLKQNYELATKEKKEFISKYGKDRYNEEVKASRPTAILEYLINRYLETVNYLKLKQRLP